MASFGILKHHGLAALPAERAVARKEDRGTPGDTHASLDAFYAAGGERRTLSIEHDFGVMWREGTHKRPRYRLSWIEATGELYTLALSEFEHQRKVELLGIVDAHEQVEQLLMGWEALPFGESTLDWVRERIAHA